MSIERLGRQRPRQTYEKTWNLNQICCAFFRNMKKCNIDFAFFRNFEIYEKIVQIKVVLFLFVLCVCIFFVFFSLFFRFFSYFFRIFWAFRIFFAFYFACFSHFFLVFSYFFAFFRIFLIYKKKCKCQIVFFRIFWKCKLWAVSSALV